jgi:hypothetical protein
MSNVKNFGLIGVGSDLQFGKAGTRLVNNAGTFNFKAANGSTDAALTAAGITSSGNVTLSSGNVVLSATGGTVSIGGTQVLQRSTGGVGQLSGTGGVVLPAGTTAQRATGETGLIRFNTDVSNQHTVEFWDGDAWLTLATGGNTGALQTEIDAIETAMGAAMNTDGTFNASGFTGSAAGATSFTDAIQQVADAAAAKDTLDEILPGTAGQIIYNNAGTWAVAVPGATSGVQGYDAGLAALAAKTSTGIMVQTGGDTYASRTLVAPVAGITISDADGVAGNPTFALADDLAALEGLASTGFAVRTGTSTWAQRSITGTSGRVVVTAGDGVSGDPTIDLATVTNSGTGTFQKLSTDSYGRVTGTEAVVAADITGLVDGTYVNVAGDTMTGNLSFGGTQKVTNLAEPTSASDAATKNYVDNAVTGLSWKQAVHVLSTSNVPLTGSTPLVIDGHTVADQDRVLLTGQSTGSENGIYVFTDGGATYTMARAADANTYQELNGAAVFVQVGTLYADTGWTQTATLTSFSGQNWAQFSGAGSYSAGDGLLLTGTVFSVNMGAGITTLPSDEVGLDIVSGKAVQLTSAATGGQLTFVLDTGSGLEQSASGLKISAAGVTNAMLANSGFNLTADSGTETLTLGQTLHIQGNAASGTSVAVALDGAIREYTVSVGDAAYAQKGVASFTTGEFVVTAGAVALGTVPTNKLQNNSITFTGTSGSDAVVLGESMAIISADSAITTTMGANSLSIQLNTVDVAHGGTGLTSLTAGQILVGNGTSAVALDADLAFNAGTNTLTVGSATIQGAAGGDVTITATGTNGDINLVPNGTGQVVIGPAGDGVISADAGQTLSIIGNDTLVLSSTAGDIVMTLAANTTDKVTVSGPTATQYATNLADADLVNKKYVDDAIQSGAASGSIKAVKATVNLGATGSTNIGAALPAGATILRVKVNVTAADSGTGTLEVGKTGLLGGYMATTENDPQTTGLYLAETYVTEGSSVQVLATVAGSAASGSATVIVEYQVA